MNQASHHASALAALSAGMLVMAGCEKGPDASVANGVARLGVLGVGALVSVINDDSTCGFGSAAVNQAAVVEGPVGGEGTVTWTVRSCRVNLGTARHVLQEDCMGERLWAAGAATITATRTIRGYITGDPTTPVIPTRADSVTISLENAQLERFAAGSSRADAALVIVDGSLSASIHPRLAANASAGLCAVPTPHVLVDRISFSNAHLHLDVAGNGVDLTASESFIVAQAGQGQGRENRYGGFLVLEGRSYQLPAGGESADLDPDYTRARFLKSYACTPDLALPVSHECADVVEMFGNAVARFSVATLGAATAVAQKDTACGFSSPAVQHGAQWAGQAGAFGTVRSSVTSPCDITVVAPEAIGDPDCHGNPAPTVQGRLRVTGTMVMDGMLTGDPVEPAVPVTRDPVTIQLRTELFDVDIRPPGAPASFHVVSGTLMGTVRPRLGLRDVPELGPGARLCAAPTPIVEVTDLHWENAVVRIDTSAGGFRASVPAATLRAVNGERDGESNVIAGTVFMGERAVVIPPGSGLDPSFDAAAFHASFERSAACPQGAELAESDQVCRDAFTRSMAPNVARLLVMGAGAAAYVTQFSPSCGLPMPGTMPALPGSSTNAEGNLVFQWQGENCPVSATDAVVQQECSGRRITASTQAQASADFQMAFPVPGQSPTDTRIVLRNFAPTRLLVNRDAGPATPTAAAQPAIGMEMIGGTLSADLHPVLGRSATLPLHVVPTPLVRISSLAVNNARLVLHAGAKTFSFNVETASLRAAAGIYGGSGNYLDGFVTLDGVTATLVMVPLDPEYEQAAFDQSYACTPDLLATLPPG